MKRLTSDEMKQMLFQAFPGQTEICWNASLPQVRRVIGLILPHLLKKYPGYCDELRLEQTWDVCKSGRGYNSYELRSNFSGSLLRFHEGDGRTPLEALFSCHQVRTTVQSLIAAQTA